MKPEESKDREDCQAWRTRREIIKGLALTGMSSSAVLSAESGTDVSKRVGSPSIHSPHLEQWAMQEITLQSNRLYRNPFKEVALYCTFTSGSHSMTVSGFYDGDATWRVRFMPDTQGHWTFATKSNDPSLDNKRGDFDVRPAKDGNHGPVRVANRFHFSYADGAPFYPLGTTTYQIF
jgi:hypothetical protein